MSFIRRIPSLIKKAFANAAAVHRKTGKPAFFILCDMALCIPVYGIAPDQYRHFGFEGLKPAQRRGHMSMYHQARLKRNVNSIYHKQFFTNKFYFSRIFADHFGRVCFRSKSITEAQLGELGEKFVYKPLAGEAGDGVLVLRKADFDCAVHAVQRLRSMQAGVVEPFIAQHEALAAYYPKAINPVRVATVFSGGVCHFLYGTLTLGVGEEFANASKDALFALIDVETGMVITDGVDYEHNTYKTHPVSGLPIKGFALPMWSEVRAMLEDSAALVPEMGYISWDIALTPERPVLIEGNTSGGYTGYQFYEFAEQGVDTETAKFIAPFIKKGGQHGC